MKFIKNSIFEIISVLLIILYVSTDIISYYFFPLIFIIASIYDIYKTKKYLKEKPKNEIRIRTKNDSYYNLIPFILGSIFCLFSVFYYFVTEKLSPKQILENCRKFDAKEEWTTRRSDDELLNHFRFYKDISLS